MNGRIYVELHLTFLHTKYTSFGSCGFRDEDFIMYFHYKPMEDNDVPGVSGLYGPVGRIYEEELHCYTHKKKKALGLVVSEKKIFFFMFVPL